MGELLTSFKQHAGFRGLHVHSEEVGCRFLAWDEVVAFISNIPSDSDPEFSDYLLEVLANYNPDKEFLVLHQDANEFAIQLYHLSQG